MTQPVPDINLALLATNNLYISLPDHLKQKFQAAASPQGSVPAKRLTLVALKYFLEDFSMDNDEWFEVKTFPFIRLLPELKGPKLFHFGDVLNELLRA